MQAGTSSHDLFKSHRQSCALCSSVALACLLWVNTSTSRGPRVKYAGTGADDSYEGSTWSGKNANRGPVSASASLLPLQTDICRLVSPEISELADSSPPDGGGLGEDPNDSLEGTQTQYVGGLLPGLGECDVVLVLDDGSRLPVHSCLLAAFSGTFRDLFLRRNGLSCQGLCCDGTCCSSGELVGSLAGSSDASPAVADYGVGVDNRRKRSRDVQPLLAGGRSLSEGAGDKRTRQAPDATSEAAVAAAGLTATSIAENRVWQSPAVIEWKPARGDVLVRFWGAGTMAAVVRHLYTGQSPADVHMDGLGRLLVASVALRMPRLMRQVEHLLSASLSSQKGSDRSAQLKEVARLLRAARVLRATDLEHRCTLYLQANGGFPAVMKVKCGCGTCQLLVQFAALGDESRLTAGSVQRFDFGIKVFGTLAFRLAQFEKYRTPPPFLATRSNLVATPGATSPCSERVGRYTGFGPSDWQRLPGIRSRACMVIVGGGLCCFWFHCCGGGGGGEACGGLVPSQACGGFRPARSSTARPA